VKGATTEYLSAALALMSDEEALEAQGFRAETAIPKQLLGALIEQAFPGVPSRGLAYPEEMSDIADYLTNIATTSAPDRNREETLLATGGAWAEWACEHDDKASRPRIATSFAQSLPSSRAPRPGAWRNA
jgi:hypothetical protein